MKTNFAPYTKQERALFSRHITPLEFITGGRNAACLLGYFTDSSIFLKDDQLATVVWISTKDSGLHGQWFVTEFARDTQGREWIAFNDTPMVMDDFGTLVEVTQ